ncbi:YfhO family protein [Anaerorhabdus furcosa]|uniref:Membrane protein YfhO n=1 Tax=Anaerorhabdus furcosa TaxID=118967 RepID=A0A1T4LUF0_9FIRM|nr:YfhO family protein [Anaerorhabdus furcosa]SJZ58271.1 membrane protein YfhO [Anaerorhabdus furcosa]
MKYLTNKKIVIFYCFLISLIFVYPLFSKNLVIGHDTLFHLGRIEALKDAYVNFDFFPRLYYHQNFMFGYATPLFYSDIFLILPALLRLMGLSLVFTYKLYLFICSFISVLCMFWASKKIVKNTYGPYLSSLLYLFCTYRITDVYVRGALGEVMAMIFIPLVIYGMYNSIYEEKPKCMYLVIGFSGLLLVHNISFILFCIVYGIVLIINFKTLIKDKYRIAKICKAMLLSLGLLAFFLLPMFEQLRGGNYAVNEFVKDSNISNYTLYFEQLFTIRLNFGLAGHEFGREYWMTTNTGPVIWILSVFYLFVRKDKTKESRFISILGFVGIGSMIFCLNIMPWSFFNNFFSFIQFPWRLMIVACSLLSIVAAKSIDYFPQKKSKLIIIIIFLITTLIGIYQLSFVCEQDTKIFNNTEYDLISDDSYSGKHGIVTYYNQAELAAADYLPIKDNVNYREYGDYVKTNNPVQIENFSRQYNKIEFSIESSDASTFYILPLIYYKGYSVDVLDDHNKLIKSISTYPDDESYLVSFNPGEYNQRITLRIQYEGTRIQFISYGITGVTLVYLIISAILNRKGKRK